MEGDRDSIAVAVAGGVRETQVHADHDLLLLVRQLAERRGVSQVILSQRMGKAPEVLTEAVGEGFETGSASIDHPGNLRQFGKLDRRQGIGSEAELR